MGRGLLRIGELSRRTGVGIDALRAWERRYGLLEPQRSDGGFRLYADDDVVRVRLMQHYLDRGLATSTAAALVAEARRARREEHPGIPPAMARAAIAAIGEGLERFDATPAARVLDRLERHFTACAVLTDVVLPYLREVGERWACGGLTVAQEHFATSFLEARLLAHAQGWGGGRGPCAVLAALPGEHHLVGLVAFGVVLRDAGWRIVLLGADMPVDGAAEAARRVEADALVLSAVAPERLASVTALDAGRLVALGGAATRGAERLPAGAIVLPEDLAGAARALRAAVAGARG